MKTTEICARIIRPFVWLGLAAALVQLPLNAGLVEETFPVLKTRTGTYTNVTVTTKAENYVFIVHSTGMASIKIPDLPVEIRRQLGYAVPETPAPQNNGVVVSVAAREPASVNKANVALANSLDLLRHLHFKLSSEAVLTVLAFVVLFHLFYSYCCNLICLKTGCEGSLLVWLPLFQLIPLFRAANMSGWWFLAIFVPGLNIVALILWSLNIAKARGKEVWVGILLLLPGTNLFTFLYLAFSNSSPPEIPTPKFQAKGLQADSS
jgi:hypothetical protein